MKIDRPFKQLRDDLREYNRENKELLKYTFEKSDNISLWVIGLSIGAISIFANNISDIQKVISPNSLKPILTLLAISVTSGIIYRGLYLYFFVVHNNALRGIDIAFSNQRTMATKSNLNGKETFKELTAKVESDFGDDLSYLIPLNEKLDENGRTDLYNSVVDHYLKSVKFAQEDTAMGLDFISETYSKFFGVSKSKLLNNLYIGDTGKHYKRTLGLTTLFYFIYLASFILALFIFVYAA